MRVQGVIRGDRGLDNGGKAHARVAAAGLKGPPFGVRERCLRPARLGATMKFGQQQTRSVHVAASDMRMDVDGAGRHDLAGGVIRLIGSAVGGRVDYPPIAEPDVGDAIPAVGGVDHAATLDPGQHGPAPMDGSAAMIYASASATEMARLGFVATAGTSVPVAAQCSTAS